MKVGKVIKYMLCWFVSNESVVDGYIVHVTVLKLFQLLIDDEKGIAWANIIIISRWRNKDILKDGSVVVIG
jgi:hypothetical protein